MQRVNKTCYSCYHCKKEIFNPKCFQREGIIKYIDDVTGLPVCYRAIDCSTARNGHNAICSPDGAKWKTRSRNPFVLVYLYWSRFWA